MNKENEYIQIESIREIQDNLRMDLLDKKYIDRDGNRFAVRFGKESRKLEIFRIKTRTDLKSDSKDGSLALSKHINIEDDNLNISDILSQEDILQKSKEKIREADKAELESMFTSVDTTDMLGDVDLNIESTVSPIKGKFDNSLVNPISILDEKRYIFDLLKSVDKNKDRVLSTLSNVKTSKIFELTGDPSENSNIISNFTREFEGDIFRILDNLQNKYKEIVSFPKSINHYSMNYSIAQKDFLATLENDKTRLDYILRWDMQEPTLLLVKKFAKMVTSLLGVLNKKEEEQIKSLSFQQQTLFRDSKSATMYCLNDLDFLKRSIENWIQSAV